MARLGLTKYDKDAPLQEELVNVIEGKRLLLSQHIGAPAQAIVNVGDMVTEGQMIAQPAQGLSVGIHATISGKVTEVTDRHVVIGVIHPPEENIDKRQLVTVGGCQQTCRCQGVIRH